MAKARSKRQASDIAADWNVGSPTTVSGRLRKAGVSVRKCRLFCVACCRASAPFITHGPCLDLLAVTEAWADDPGRTAEVARLRRSVGLWANKTHVGAVSDQDWLVRWSVWCAADPKIVPPAQGFLKPDTFRPLLREVFGDTLSGNSLKPAWLTSDVVGIARGCYEDRAFDRLPILADALEDAGCDDHAVLSHCRGSGAHVRGCWVVDLVLGQG